MQLEMTCNMSALPRGLSALLSCRILKYLKARQAKVVLVSPKGYFHALVISPAAYSPGKNCKAQAQLPFKTEFYTWLLFSFLSPSIGSQCESAWEMCNTMDDFQTDVVCTAWLDLKLCFTVAVSTKVFVLIRYPAMEVTPPGFLPRRGLKLSCQKGLQVWEFYK